jgi:quercetin dioxygenase-like cupin family protein
MELYKIDRASAHDATASGNFGGQVWMQRLITEQQSHDIELLVVSFEAGGRTRPHIHAVDQILHIISGRGIVATGSERRFVEPGDVVLVPAGEWHWHGAAPDSAMTHISIKRYGQTDWTVEERDWGTYA